ncbi:unnamed protein product [Urochloa decumbens]|uniref:F-box domain-containing protein n=1 Tax=Urochloa decumbens TaxID=240449 RepID=A0ABC9B5X5_9POAL
METCSRASSSLCRLFLRALPKLFASSPGLLKTCQMDEPVHGTDLPQDILTHIFALLETPDLVRAGAVCSSWRAAYTSMCITGHCRLNQTPCLLYTSESGSASAMGLYSLAEKKAYTLTLPDPSGMVADGSPSTFAPSELRNYLFYKAFLSSDPCSGDYFVVLIHNPHSQLSFARAGDDKWTWLPPHTYYEDCLFNDGLLYASTLSGEIHAFDLGAPVVEASIVLGRVKDYLLERIYIVQAPSGELLQIWRSLVPPQGDEEDENDSDIEPELNDDSQLCNTFTINVHKVDLTSKDLVEISSLGQNVLFLGHNQSLFLSAEEYPQLKANHVYFTDDDFMYITWHKNNRRDIGVFDLGNNSSEEIVSPQLWSNWPTPLWLIPNPRRMSSACCK